MEKKMTLGERNFVTKRGNKFRYNVQRRDTKQTVGFRLHLEGKSSKNDVQNELVVCGTFDKIGRGNWLFMKLGKIEHPTDKGYFKQAYILTDKGKAKLERLRKYVTKWGYNQRSPLTKIK